LLIVVPRRVIDRCYCSNLSATIPQVKKGETPVKKTLIILLSCVFILCFYGAAIADPVNQVAYGSLSGTGLITFDDIAGGGAPGTNYDSIFVSGGAGFGERFLGQTLATSGNFDQLSGSPSATLQLVAGAANQNLNVFTEGSSQVLTGLGNLGYPSFDAIGEGAFAVLFANDQSQFGFQLVGGNAGDAFISFFGRNGSLIDSITLTGLADAYYGFERDGGIKDIAGISIYNNDLAGIGFDNLKHDVPGIIVTPEPMTILLLGMGLVGLAGLRRKSQ
jgi:hypothetical protein